MTKVRALKFDEIGYWSEIKLDIVKDYATAYSVIFNAPRQRKLQHLYIDAFAGLGVHISRSTGDFVPGSPLNALQVKPPFREYHFIDLDSDKVANLRKIVGNRLDVHFYEGDCNSILLDRVFPRAKFEHYRRALCLLDPYGLHLDWKVIETAGRMQSIDMFLNFPIADMNRNVLWQDPEAKGIRTTDIRRLTAFWGDETWRQIAYSTTGNLFGFQEKEDNDRIALAFQKRLKQIAGFKYVPLPLPMRNTKGATVYYLFFASQKPVASDIVESVFKKYQERGVK
jgi:three-Cys-motif partner protein